MTLGFLRSILRVSGAAKAKPVRLISSGIGDAAPDATAGGPLSASTHSRNGVGGIPKAPASFASTSVDGRFSPRSTSDRKEAEI